MNASPPIGHPLDQPLIITLFDDHTATTKREWRGSLRQFAPAILSTTAPAKEALPWLKLAEVGTHRSKKGSLRNNPNMRWIWGIEADYHAGLISVDQAVDTLRRNNIAAMVYTSPSHTPEKPRWRVLCPTSEPLPPEERAALVARLNGLFNGALSRESFTLSQAYFFGAVE
jgi:hypothetical protein